MYFESKVFSIKQVKDTDEVAVLIKSGQVRGYEALQWQVNGFSCLCVPNGHVDNPFLEVAILRVEADNSYSQLDSITAGWISTAEQLAICLKEAEKQEPRWEVQLIVDRPKGDERARFACSCCGECFMGNVKEQLKHDQDDGYGLCPVCE